MIVPLFQSRTLVMARSRYADFYLADSWLRNITRHFAGLPTARAPSSVSEVNTLPADSLLLAPSTFPTRITDAVPRNERSPHIADPFNVLYGLRTLESPTIASCPTDA